MSSIKDGVIIFLRTNALVRVMTDMVRKVFRVGHSYCVTIPKKMLGEVGLEYTDWAWVELDEQGKRIIIRRRRDNEW